MSQIIGLEATSRLSMVIAAKTGDVMREAVTRFLKRDDWQPDELHGRGAMKQLPSGTEVFYLDGVALVKLYPLHVTQEIKDGSVVFNATQRHRFLVPNAAVAALK